jgi:hypothetical protein
MSATTLFTGYIFPGTIPQYLYYFYLLVIFSLEDMMYTVSIWPTISYVLHTEGQAGHLNLATSSL